MNPFVFLWIPFLSTGLIEIEYSGDTGNRYDLPRNFGVDHVYRSAADDYEDRGLIEPEYGIRCIVFLMNQERRGR